MPGPIERWLETFMCGQFAENFDRFGYRTLQSVCQLQIPQLMSMGIPQNDSEVIYQNIQLMCHSSNMPHQQMPMRNMYGNRMPMDMHGVPCSSQSQMNCLPQDNSCYNFGNQNVGSSGQFYNQGMQQQLPDMMNSQYRQQYHPGPGGYTNQQPQPDRQFPCMSMSSSNSNMSNRNNYAGHVPGSPLIGHSNMRQSHPHLRNSGQNPQEVANNILHMAASSYPTNHTVQVPLSKNRSAPYHLPNRSPSYNTQAQDNQQSMGHDYNQSQGHFMYPSPPHQSPLQQQGVRDPRMSPASPGSGNMCSPLSHHSGRSMPSSSPCSMHSPGIGNVRSPGPNSQMMNSPQRNSYPMSSPMNVPNQRMVSPVPTSQQLQVNVPSSVSQQIPQCYNSNNMNSLPFQNHPSQAMTQYSPGLSSCNSPGSHSSHVVQSPNAPSGGYSHSPGGQSGYCSNISSPFTPNSRVSYHSPSQTHPAPMVDSNIPEASISNITPAKQQCTSPLQSLQKLCMLPESQVVDPKSVVKEACVNSPVNVNHKNVEQPSDSNVEPNQYSCNTDDKHSDSDCTAQDTQPSSNASDSVISPDKCQPKKMMLLRAAKEDFSSDAQDSSVIPVSSEASISNSCEDLGSTSSQNDTSTNVSSNDCFDNTVVNESGIHKTNEVVSETVDNYNLSNANDSNLTHENTDITNSAVESSEFTQPEGNKETVGTIDNESAVEKNDSSHNDVANGDNDDNGACSKDSGADNVQLNGNDVLNGTENVQSDEVQASVVSDCSISDTESPLVVRKDIQNTYSKQERLKSFELTPRQRADSTGSLSDHYVNSDFEYEDHIGCDDIETGFSDIDEKANDLDESASERVKSGDSCITPGVVVIDTVNLSCSPWKKGKIQDEDGKKKRKNGRYHVNRVKSISDYKLDNIPSPLGGDVVDGIDEPISLDMGDGTVAISRPSRIRQRKTPVKYKDTSFFQGDFVFIDEEENTSHSVSKKKSTIKKTDFNCNSKKSNVAEKSRDLKNKNINEDCKSDDPAKSVVEPVNAPEIKAVVEVSPSQNLEQTIKLLAAQHDKIKNENGEKGKSLKVCVISKNSNGHLTSTEIIQGNEDFDCKNCEEDDAHDTGTTSCSKVTKSQSKQSAGRKTRSPVTRNSAKRSRSNKSVSNVKAKRTKQTNQEVNGIKTEKNCETTKLSTMTRSRKNNIVSNDNNVEANVDVKVESKPLKNENVVGTDCDVIEIKSDDDDEVVAINDSGAKVSDNCSASKSAHVNCDGTQVYKPNDNEYVFNLIDDDSRDNVDNDETVDVKVENLNIFEGTSSDIPKFVERTSSGKQKKASKSYIKNVKSQKKVRNSKRKALDYEDPDFDLGPSLKFLKSCNSENLNNKRIKKKTDKWADFKGPKIVFEGERETPDKCAVINDPYEQTSSKKAKLITQNVTRIEISQLPSDKSVLIPNNDTMESEIWKCALCGKHSSYKFLGDLFGPYSVETMSEDMLDLSPKVRLGSGKKWDDNQPGSSKGGRSGKRSDSASRDVCEWKEVWVHESCAVYSDGVFLLGTKIYGLQEAIRIASQTLCTVCDTHGAMIGCLNKGCQQKFHHTCAQEADCYLDEENFSLLCPKHKVKKLKQLEALSNTMNNG